MLRKALLTLAALSAAIAIAASAFAAHGASERAANLLRIGGQYQLIHAVAVLAIYGRPRSICPAIAMLGGATLFALSLYALALGAPHWFGIITPFGGGAMIVGWLWLAVQEGRNIGKRD